MPVLEMHLATVRRDGALNLFEDQLITPKGMDRLDAIACYRRNNPSVRILTSRWLTVAELAPQLPQLSAPVAPPPAPAPKPRPVWPNPFQVLRTVWPASLALGGLLLINAVATIDHVRADIERTQLEALR